LTKLLPNVGFNGSIRPDIAGSPPSGKWKAGQNRRQKRTRGISVERRKQ
jgi:hypothetical protein